MATSERTPEDCVVDSASACILTMPSMPIAIMINATITSMRLKPRVFVCWLMVWLLGAGRQGGGLLHGDVAGIGDLQAARPRRVVGRIMERDDCAAGAAHGREQPQRQAFAIIRDTAGHPIRQRVARA